MARAEAQPVSKAQLTEEGSTTLTIGSILFFCGIAFCAGAGFAWRKLSSEEPSKPNTLGFHRSPSYSKATVFGQAVAGKSSFENAEQTLRQEEQQFSFIINRPYTKGCAHVARVASNAPVEDNWTLITGPDNDLYPMPFFGVFDGHAGSSTSNFLADSLLQNVRSALQGLSADQRSSKVINETIKRCFVAADKMLMDNGLRAIEASKNDADPEVMDALAPVVAGSCALVASFDSSDDTLRVACVGDSRAVLGQYSTASGKYETTAMSEDQSGSSKSEIARLNAEHPKEPDMLEGLNKQGRIFGLMCTRAFGDHRWKYDEDTVTRIQQDYFGQAPRPKMKTPPYVTAEPEITEEKILRDQKTPHQISRPSFVILATDGLWDYMSSDDAVRCVEKWLDDKVARWAGARNGAYPPVPLKEGDDTKADKKLFKLVDGYAEWRYRPDWYTCRDDNAATHLIRNAFGGKHESFFAGIMSSRPPTSRNIRDDVTVQVIFFDDAPGVRW